MSDTVIRVENLSKRYRLGATIAHNTLRDQLAAGAQALFRRSKKTKEQETEDFWALKDINFEVKQGEVLGIIGRNGAGKSTLLKILSRITAPTTGSAEINGRVGSLLEVGTGFHSELTGRENIYMNAAILGMTRQEINRKFDEIVTFAEVEKFIDTPVKRYSSGMLVRLAFSVAAHIEPEVLVIDEVLAVGDASFQKKCLGKMGAVAGEGRTVLFVSHNMGAVSQLCSRAILLDQGQLAKDGDTDDVISDYINTGKDGSHTAEYAVDPEKPVQIMRYGVRDMDNNPITQIPYTKPFQVFIDYDIRDWKVGSWVALNVFDTAGNFIIASMDVTSDEEMDEKRASGHYQTNVIIPGNTLRAGMHTFLTGIFVPGINHAIDSTPVNEVSLDIIDNESMFSRFGMGQPGIITTPLAWKTKTTVKGERA